MARHVKQVVTDASTLDYITTDDDAIDWAQSRTEIQATPEELETLGRAQEAYDQAVAAEEVGRADALREELDKVLEDLESAVQNRKRAAHLHDWDLSKLTFLEGRQPTVWVFRHPMRRDVRNWYIDAAVAQQSGGAGVSTMMVEGCSVALFAKREGLRGKVEILPVDGTGQKLSPNYLQALHDSDLVGELSMAFLKKTETIHKQSTAAAKKK